VEATLARWRRSRRGLAWPRLFEDIASKRWWLGGLLIVATSAPFIYASSIEYYCCHLLQRTTYHRRTPCVKVLMTQNKMLDSSVWVRIDKTVSTRACRLVMTDPTLSKCLDIVIMCHVGWANIGRFGCLETRFSQMSGQNNQVLSSPCFLPSSSSSSDHHYYPLLLLRPCFPC
jgi:hypothetical protein